VTHVARARMGLIESRMRTTCSKKTHVHTNGDATEKVDVLCTASLETTRAIGNTGPASWRTLSARSLKVLVVRLQ
jgi:hypothetical protein